MRHSWRQRYHNIINVIDSTDLLNIIPIYLKRSLKFKELVKKNYLW